MISSAASVFVATAVTGGLLLASPRVTVTGGFASTESLVVADGLVSRVTAHEVVSGPLPADAGPAQATVTNQTQEEVPDGRARR